MNGSGFQPGARGLDDGGRQSALGALRELSELSKAISIGLSVEELKKRADEERLRRFLVA